MKACEAYLDVLMRSIDGETSPQEEAALQAHLATCPDCQALYDSYRLLDQGIRDLQEEPPAQLTGAIMEGIRREQHPRLFRRFRFSALAAVIALVVLLGAKYLAPDHMVGADTDAVETAEAVGAAQAADVPVVAAEFRSANQETAETAEEAPEEENTLADEGAVESSVSLSGAMEDLDPDLEDALANADCQGSAYVLSDITAAQLQALFPELTATALENGMVAYAASRTAVEERIQDGTLTPAQGRSQEGEQCWLILQSQGEH
jgi:hypothetical protein